MSKDIFSMKQLEAILDQFNLDPKQVLPEIAFRKDFDLKHQWIDKLEIDFRPEGSDVKVKISGLYAHEYTCSYRDAGIWKPTSRHIEKFEYETTLEPKD